MSDNGAPRRDDPESGPQGDPESSPQGSDLPAGVSDPTTMRIPGIGSVEPAENIQGEHTLTRADQATVDALRPGTALLVVLRGPNTGARFLLDDDEVTSGRHPESDIFLDDVTVSRRHATFRRSDGKFVVRDIGSLNGTYVNRERIDNEWVLETGDEVQIGKYRLVFYAARD